jgi:hypothetical protein
MKKNLILTAFLGLNLLGLLNCAPANLGSNNYGYLNASVKFPDKKFSLKTIPESTENILVTISGEGYPQRSALPLFTRENPSLLLLDVPEGQKVISAFARNKGGQVIATGSNTVNVIARKFNTVTVVLSEEAVAPTPTPRAVPTPTPTPVASREPGSEGPLGSAVPSVSITAEPSAIPSSTPVVDEKCIVKISQADLPLSSSLEQAIKDAGCDIAFPSPQPTATVTTSSGSGGSGSGGSSTSSVPVTVNVNDGADVPAGVGLETPGP